MSVPGQGTFTSLVTGGGQALVSAERQVTVPAVQSDLLFRFGFATEETVVPGQFLDSFSITIHNILSGDAAVLVTADASGFSWAPLTPGAFPLNPSAINRHAAEFPSLEPVLTMRTAFDVSLALPDAFLGAPVNVYFDLFDNNNSLRSLGFFSEPVVVVPEPSAWLLASVAVLLIYRFRPGVK